VDPDSFFTDPDPGIFLQSGSWIRIQAKPHFFKGNNKILGEKYLALTKKVGWNWYFIFVFNQKSSFGTGTYLLY